MANILLIDDDETMCRAIKTILERTGGHSVTIEVDPKKGLARAMDKVPDLIMLDIVMPDMDGIEVLQRLREDSRTMLIPVVMLTGLADKDAIKDAMHLYAEQYIVKPPDPKTLNTTIQKILARHIKL